MASKSDQWQALAEQFQVICPKGGTPGAGPPGVLQGQVSCGHWVTAAGLRDWVRALLDQGVISFHCPRCPDTPWLWQELCKLSLFSDEDRVTLEAKILAQTGARGSYRQCPRCQKLIQCVDPETLRTPCLPCSQQTGELYCFCWGCRKDWRNPSHEDGSCSNPQCNLQAMLYDAPEIQAPETSVHGCPSVRACPECYALVSHTGQGCPLVECPECWLEFCFRCLRSHLGEDDEMEYDESEDEGLYDDDYCGASCAIAGRQELNGPPKPMRDFRLTPASTPENSPPSSPDPDIAPSPTAPALDLGTSSSLASPPGSRDVGGNPLSPGCWATERNNAFPRYGGTGAIAPSPGYWDAEGTVISPSYWSNGALGPSPGSWGAEGAFILPRYWDDGSIVPFPGYWGAEEIDISSRYWTAGVLFPSIAYWGGGGTSPSYGCSGTGLALGSPFPSSTRGDKPPTPPFF